MTDGTDTASTRRITVWLHEDPPNLDSQMVVDDWSWRIHSLCFEGLARRGPDGAVAPGNGLAEAWDSSADRREWTFRLREGLRWSDGVALTAEHVLASVRRSADPRTPRRSAWSMYVIQGVRACHRDTDGSDEQVEAALERVGVDVLGPREVRFRLSQPVPFLPDLLALPSWAPLRPDAPPPSGPDAVASGVYSGPFVMASYVPGERISYRRNPEYWDAARLRLDQVEVLIGGDPLSRFRDGSVDVIPIDGLDTMSVGPEELHQVEEAVVVYLVCNTNDPVLADLDARRAVAGAIDRRAVAGAGLAGSVPATGLVPNAIARGAFRAAAAAGLPRVEGPATLPPGQALRLMCGDAPGNVAEAREVAGQLQDRLGVVVEVEPTGFADRFQRIRAGDYQMAIVAWKADYDDPFGLLVEHVSDGAAGNQSKWSSPEYNSLLERARTEADSGERLRLLVRAEALLLEHAAIQPLVYRSRFWAVRKSVRGLVHVPFGPSPELRWATSDVEAALR